MRVYWREHKIGQQLILNSGTGEEEVVGTVRRTPSGFDAAAKTLGYEPGRSHKGFPSMEDAKAFVESFHPWDIYLPQELRQHAEVEFDRTLHPIPEKNT